MMPVRTSQTIRPPPGTVPGGAPLAWTRDIVAWAAAAEQAAWARTASKLRIVSLAFRCSRLPGIWLLGVGSLRAWNSG